jgi:ribosomal protein S18 acetylase RimI-like enzyme
MTPDPAEVMDALSAYQAELDRQVPGFDGLVEPDIVLAAIGLPIARANSANAARFTAVTADRRIDEVIAWFAARRLPFVWHLGPSDQPTDLVQRLTARGFVLSLDEMPGMVAPLDALPALELPADASLERVGDVASLRSWLEVLVAGFEMPAIMGETFLKFGSLGFGPDMPEVYLARLSGRPVATALAVVVGGGVVITNVTTLSDARGKGLGRAITLAAMHHGARAGAAIAVLQSSEMGFRIYRSLGFEEFGRYRTLTRETT